jgi:proteasome lid subunit RPN8/RPN11
LQRAAEDAAGEEAWGLLLGTRDADCLHVRSIRVLPNRAADPRSQFGADPGELVAAWDAAAADGPAASVLGVWHSHPRGPAVFSAADRESAARWPDLAWLLLARDAGSWRFVDLDGRVLSSPPP